jgi:hypothetical protein
MSGQARWTSTCDACGHLANVHIPDSDLDECWVCQFCDCAASPMATTAITERVARALHPAELLWISKRWP